MKLTTTVIGADQLIAKFHSLPAQLRAAIRDALPELQNELVVAIQKLLSGELLHNRTNLLRSSIVAGAIVEDGSEIYGVVGTNTRYARMQELGGTVTPQNASALTIPLAAVLTANGVARFTAREIFDDPAAGGFSGVFIKNATIFGKTGAGKGGVNLTPLFLLRQSVTIPGAHYMAAGVAEVQADVIARLKGIVGTLLAA